MQAGKLQHAIELQRLSEILHSFQTPRAAQMPKPAAPPKAAISRVVGALPCPGDCPLGDWPASVIDPARTNG